MAYVWYVSSRVRLQLIVSYFKALCEETKDQPGRGAEGQWSGEEGQGASQRNN